MFKTDTGALLHMFAVAHSPDGSHSSEELNWTSSIDGFLGSGSQLIVHTLSIGRHCISLEVGDGCGNETSDRINITIKRKRDY